jgi:hypothetical protein
LIYFEVGAAYINGIDPRREWYGTKFCLNGLIAFHIFRRARDISCTRNKLDDLILDMQKGCRLVG